MQADSPRTPKNQIIDTAKIVCPNAPNRNNDQCIDSPRTPQSQIIDSTRMVCPNAPVHPSARHRSMDPTSRKLF